MQRALLLISQALFGALTAVALWHLGSWGDFEPHFKNWGSAQGFDDLVIALPLVMVWMWHNAPALGRYVWPWIGLTLVAGSLGPSLFFLTRSA